MKKVENFVTKGEIARFEKLLLLSQCFQTSSATEVSESVYGGKRLRLSKSRKCLTSFTKEAFKNLTTMKQNILLSPPLYKLSKGIKMCNCNRVIKGILSL